MLTFAQTGRGKGPSPRGEPSPGPLRHPLGWGDLAENHTGLPTPLFTPSQKNPHKTTPEGALSTRFPHLCWGLRAGGNPLAEAEKGFA